MSKNKLSNALCRRVAEAFATAAMKSASDTKLLHMFHNAYSFSEIFEGDNHDFILAVLEKFSDEESLELLLPGLAEALKEATGAKKVIITW